MNTSDVLVIGSGLGALSSAVLLSNKGLKVRVVEQNWQPGGCTSSYWRKGYVFEAGATTLVGLGEGMPLQSILDQTGISLAARKLDLPMQVHLKNGLTLSRFENREEWIAEAERGFGKKGQRAFWQKCFEVSDFVWKNSLKQLSFPPTQLKDLLTTVGSLSFDQLKNFPNAFLTVEDVLRKYGLNEDETFTEFVDEQLLITAQNHRSEVNFLFGAAALCYTNLPNYYIDGGLLNLAKAFTDYIEANGGEVIYREKVESINQDKGAYRVRTSKREYQAEFLVSGIPINNTLELFDHPRVQKLKSKLLNSEKLNSAFQMGVGFERHRKFESIHHQIHLETPLPETNSASIFISLNHPEDLSRTDEPGHAVMSISTHLPDPGSNIVDSGLMEKAIIDELVRRDFVREDHIRFIHSSSPKSWMKWTARKWGFVGGYPQFRKIKPWQMLDARLDGHKAYQVGDTVYPGQGIPGVTLSGLIAVEKLCKDWRI
ncbi:phytoene desaturase family protein [Roseivirga sp.]|uniref:phytoene desaturase family protein n=1 Tax=Roseivirga sp. TaxID=1964215 RepID=UPI003B52D96E